MLFNSPTAISPAWSSSMIVIDSECPDATIASAMCFARCAVIVTPVGFCARGCKNNAVGFCSSAAVSASTFMPWASTSTPMTSAPIFSSRSSNGGKVGCSTITRSPRRTTTWAMRSRASIAPSTTVSSSGTNGQRWRKASSSWGNTGWSR